MRSGRRKAKAAERSAKQVAAAMQAEIEMLRTENKKLKDI